MSILDEMAHYANTLVANIDEEIRRVDHVKALAATLQENAGDIGHAITVGNMATVMAQCDTTVAAMTACRVETSGLVLAISRAGA